MRILLIDDDEHARAYLQRALERAGHEVHLAVDGRGVDALVPIHQLDLVLTDIYMPEVDGFQALATLRANAPDLPVVVMSGGALGLGTCLQMAKMLGAAAVLEKPVTIAALLDALRVATAAGCPSSRTPRASTSV